MNLLDLLKQIFGGNFALQQHQCVGNLTVREEQRNAYTLKNVVVKFGA